MEQLNMRSKDLTQENIDKIGALFPNVLTETKDKGKIKRAIDFDLLKQELSKVLIEGEKERYQFTWPGKKEAILKANESINKTLRPIKADSVDWDNTKNLYIEGDNLEVLKLLQESYLNKMKCIYIDPPYNTGNDFLYKDDFKNTTRDYLIASGQVDDEGNRLVHNSVSNGRFHSDWLTMMYSRLLIARNLLSDNGVIFISIDDNEVSNIRKICDQVFGQDNFCGEVVVQTNKGGQDYLQLAKTHEYLLCYFKSEIGKLNLLPKTDVSSFKYEDIRGKYELRELRNRNPKFTKQNRPNLFYPIYVNPNIKDEYGCCPISLTKNEEYFIEILPLNSQGKDSCWRWGKALLIKNTISHSPEDSHVVARRKRDGGWNVYEKSRKTLTKAKTIWDETDVRTERGTIVFRELFENSYFDHPKPVELIDKILRLSMDEDSIVLDFFSGSATTAHAVLQLNAEDGGHRKFIMIQLPEETDGKSEAFKAGYKNICEIGKERIRRAAKKIKKETNAEIDYGFRVYRLDSSNMKEVFYTPDELSQMSFDDLESNIKEDRTGEDLLIQIMLETGLELSLAMETEELENKTIYRVAGHSLIACFDQDVSESLIKKIAKEQPLRVVFHDRSFADDSARINVEEMFKMLSPTTEIQVL